MENCNMKVSELFDVFSGSKLDFGKMIEDEQGVNFISRNSNNNGVVGRVQLLDEMKVYKKGDITVPLGGSFLLSCFVQDSDFVTAQNVHVLRAKNSSMSDLEKWFYCYALRQNRFKFCAFGREVNKYLKQIELPNQIPDWVKNGNISDFSTINKKTFIKLDISNWKYFFCEQLFDIDRGNLSNLNEIKEGATPVVSAYGHHQGIQYFLDVDEIYSNALTVSFNGSGTGYCAYHEYGFNANSDCGILIPKFELDKYIGLFLATCINYFAFKYMYGRKMSKTRLKKERILLPVDKNEQPDWEYMKKFMQQLPYGDRI